MKKMTCFLNLLAVSSLLFAGVNPANAVPALKGFSPNDATIINPGGAVATVKGLPAWFQGQDGVAVRPCLDLAKCLAAGAPDFNPALPLSYPTNFPSEAFYFDATNAAIPVGSGNALVVMALEFTFVDALGALVPASAPGAVGNPFQRLRLTHTFLGGGGNLALLGVPAGGSFTVTTPWGTAVFPVSSVKCVNQGGDTKCTVTRDQPVAGPNFVAALGDPALAPGSISTFLKDPAVVAAFPGFLGTGGAAASFIGAPAGNLNQITVTDPLGNTGTTTLLSALIGQTVGLEITPPATGNDFGVVKPANAVPLRKTFSINNLTGAVVGLAPLGAPAAPLLFTPNVTNVTPAVVSTDFTIAATPLAAIVAPATKACALGAGATMAIGEICSFDVIFSPVTADGPKSATILISGANTPTAQVTVTGIADGTAPTLTLDPVLPFTKLATQTLTGTIAEANNVAGASVLVTVGGVLSPGAATITAPAVAGAPSIWSKTITLPITNGANAISITATDTALTGGNVSAALTSSITNDIIPPVVAPSISPVPNAGGFINTKSPTLTPGATDNFSLASTIVTVDTTAPSTNVVPATLPLGPLAEGSHTVKVDALDSASNPATASIVFNVDSIKPAITITSPVITAAGTIGISSPSITFTIDDTNPNPAATTGTFDSRLAPGVPVALHHPIAFSTDALGKVTGTATLVDPNPLVVPDPDIVPPLTEGEKHTVTFDTTDLAGNVAATKSVTFTLLFKDGSMDTLGATPPTITDVILALKVALGGFPEVASITPTTDKFKHGDVFPLDAVTGKPIGDNKIDVGDVLTILKKVVGQITTF